MHAIIDIIANQEWMETPYTIIWWMLILVSVFWVWKRKLPVYLLDFRVYKPPERYSAS